MRALGWNTEEGREKLRSYIDEEKAEKKASEFASSAVMETDPEVFAQMVLPLLKDEDVNKEATDIALSNLHQKIRFNASKCAASLLLLALHR